MIIILKRRIYLVFACQLVVDQDQFHMHIEAFLNNQKFVDHQMTSNEINLNTFDADVEFEPLLLKLIVVVVNVVQLIVVDRVNVLDFHILQVKNELYKEKQIISVFLPRRRSSSLRPSSSLFSNNESCE
jgi:hypothetical protein